MRDGLVWTPRGRFVRNLVLTVVFLTAAYLLLTLTLPAECRGVPVAEMSDLCLDLVLM